MLSEFRWTRVDQVAAVLAIMIVGTSWQVVRAQAVEAAKQVEIQILPADAIPPVNGPAPAKPADDKNAKKDKEPQPAPVITRTAGNTDPDVIKLNLMDESIITGKLSVKEIAVETQYGTLNIPVANIRSFTPGLQSHPGYAKQVNTLIQALGSSNFNEREKAQVQLMDKMPTIRGELEKYQNDADTERRNRVVAILTQYDEAAADEPAGASPWLMQQKDVVETLDFTVVGKIVPQSFQLTSQYGPLTIQLADIRKAQRDTNKKEDLRQTISVDASNFAYKNPLNTNIRLERGDKLTITAEGTLQMQPWGNNASTTPEGNQQYGWFLGNQIAMGALIGRVGSNDQFTKIGNKYSLTVDKPGVLQLAIAMNNDYNETQFPGKFTVKIHVAKRQETP
jgi:hypothetical protein